VEGCRFECDDVVKRLLDEHRAFHRLSNCSGEDGRIIPAEGFGTMQLGFKHGVKSGAIRFALNWRAPDNVLISVVYVE
jgi:hypothetical protein